MRAVNGGGLLIKEIKHPTETYNSLRTFINEENGSRGGIEYGAYSDSSSENILQLSNPIEADLLPLDLTLTRIH